MSNPAAPSKPEESAVSEADARPGNLPGIDGPNPFGPDAPNTRPDDPKGSLDELSAPPPEPPADPLPDDAYAPDEG